MMGFQPVCTLDEILAGQAKEYDIEGTAVALCRDSDGSYHAISALCTHGEVSLAEGDIADGKVECWAHCATFDLRTGSPTLPATKPVSVYALKIEDNMVLVDVNKPVVEG